MSSMNNLSVEGQFRYIVQWFNEWSELQRDDFVPVFVEYVNGEKYINGVIGSMANADINDDKPMSLFQCRIKLFRDWSPKWPIDFKHKLKEKIVEMDTRVGEKIIGALKGHNERHSNGNGVSDDDEKVNGEGEEELITTAAAAAIVEVEAVAEEAINADAVIASNETSVDVDDEPIAVAVEPAEQVDVLEHVATTAAAVAVQIVATNNAEVPSVA